MDKSGIRPSSLLNWAGTDLARVGVFEGKAHAGRGYPLGGSNNLDGSRCKGRQPDP